jgi:hypothetical protein
MESGESTQARMAASAVLRLRSVSASLNARSAARSSSTIAKPSDQIAVSSNYPLNWFPTHLKSYASSKQFVATRFRLHLHEDVLLALRQKNKTLVVRRRSVPRKVEVRGDLIREKDPSLAHPEKRPEGK